MSKISRNNTDRKLKSFGDHKKYISRISKTLYYGKLPKTDCLSIPVTELASEFFSEAQRGKSLERLHYNDAARISHNACVSPCSIVLAMLYFDRLKKCNPEYLVKTAPSDLFLVSLMVSCKFLFDDGESDEVFIDEWAASGGITINELIKMEREFLQAIDWEIYVNEIMFWRKLTDLETMLARKQGTSRGFFTYTELECLGTTIELANLMHCLVAVSLLLAATYTAGVLTIAGSIFLTSKVPGNCLQPKPVDLPPAAPLLPKKQLDAVDVLKTGILLASIKPNNTNVNSSTESGQYMTWDWWNVPVMLWLSETSAEIRDRFDFNLNLVDFPLLSYFDSSLMNAKQTHLNDCINKATKTRIQDQMENSWHKEWTDIVKYRLVYDPLYYNYFKT